MCLRKDRQLDAMLIALSTCNLTPSPHPHRPTHTNTTTPSPCHESIGPWIKWQLYPLIEYQFTFWQGNFSMLLMNF